MKANDDVVVVAEAICKHSITIVITFVLIDSEHNYHCLCNWLERDFFIKSKLVCGVKIYEKRRGSKEQRHSMKDPNRNYQYQQHDLGRHLKKRG